MLSSILLVFLQVSAFSVKMCLFPLLLPVSTVSRGTRGHQLPTKEVGSSGYGQSWGLGSSRQFSGEQATENYKFAKALKSHTGGKSLQAHSLRETTEGNPAGQCEEGSKGWEEGRMASPAHRYGPGKPQDPRCSFAFGFLSS